MSSCPVTARGQAPARGRRPGDNEARWSMRTCRHNEMVTADTCPAADISDMVTYQPCYSRSAARSQYNNYLAIQIICTHYTTLEAGILHIWRSHKYPWQVVSNTQRELKLGRRYLNFNKQGFDWHWSEQPRRRQIFSKVANFKHCKPIGCRLTFLPSLQGGGLYIFPL